MKDQAFAITFTEWQRKPTIHFVLFSKWHIWKVITIKAADNTSRDYIKQLSLLDYFNFALNFRGSILQGSVCLREREIESVLSGKKCQRSASEAFWPEIRQN